METARKFAHELIDKINEQSLRKIIDILQAAQSRDEKLREDLMAQISHCSDPDRQKKLWLEWEALLPEEDSEMEQQLIAECMEYEECVEHQDLLARLELVDLGVR